LFIIHSRTDIPALVAAVRDRDAEIARLNALVAELTSGKQEVRCPSCGVTIDMGPIVDEVTYVGDTFDLECDQCGCEFTAHAETMTICFDAEVDEVAK
jgi:C4-type Zn-finger protein